MTLNSELPLGIYSQTGTAHERREVLCFFFSSTVCVLMHGATLSVG